MSVRARAEALAADPSQLETPVPQFDDPIEAKIEADACLAICGDAIVQRLLHEPERRVQFGSDFNEHLRFMRAVYKKAPVDTSLINDNFVASFSKAYVDPLVIGETLSSERPLGRRTVAACTQYFRTVHGARSRYSQAVSHTAYQDPSKLIMVGFTTYKHEVGLQIDAIAQSDLTPDARLVALKRGARSLLSLGSLSIAQLSSIKRDQEGCAAPNEETRKAHIAVARILPEQYRRGDEALRGKNMCPMMPNFRPTDMLSGGSPIAKLHALTLELYEDANMHFLSADENRVGYSLLQVCSGARPTA